jgi:hypothetical protein
MARRTQIFTKTEFKTTYTSEAYTDDGGATWCWVSNNRPVPLDACREYAIPCDFFAQKAAESAHLDAFMAAYRASQPATPSPEEQFELRAAFGSGKTVVDVVTGRRWTT